MNNKWVFKFTFSVHSPYGDLIDQVYFYRVPVQFGDLASSVLDDAISSWRDEIESIYTVFSLSITVSLD